MDLMANHLTFEDEKCLCKGGFSVMAEITHTLAASTRRQFFFVITTAASTRCLVKKVSNNLLFAASKCHVAVRQHW